MRHHDVITSAGPLGDMAAADDVLSAFALVGGGCGVRGTHHPHHTAPWASLGVGTGEVASPAADVAPPVLALRSERRGTSAGDDLFTSRGARKHCAGGDGQAADVSRWPLHPEATPIRTDKADHEGRRRALTYAVPPRAHPPAPPVERCAMTRVWPALRRLSRRPDMSLARARISIQRAVDAGGSGGPCLSTPPGIGLRRWSAPMNDNQQRPARSAAR